MHTLSTSVQEGNSWIFKADQTDNKNELAIILIKQNFIGDEYKISKVIPSKSTLSSRVRSVKGMCHLGSNVIRCLYTKKTNMYVHELIFKYNHHYQQVTEQTQYPMPSDFLKCFKSSLTTVEIHMLSANL